MSDIAIRVENLSKRYRIGLKEQLNDTLAGTISDFFSRPIRNLIKLRGLSAFSGNGDRKDILWALKDVSFEVRKGEVVGIIGRNGAGKSTLLKLLSRITEPTSGRAEIHGHLSSLLEVGTGFHNELTGRDNVYLNGTILGMRRKEIDVKFDEIVDFSGVERFIDTPVKRYSSGMKVRLAFAVAAHLDPDIMLVDEVLAVGDFAFQKKCLGKMQDATRQGRTVLFVSHHMGSIKILCDRCLLFEEGRILMDGSTESIVQAYIDQSQTETRGPQSNRLEPDSGGGFVLHHGRNYGHYTISCGDPLVVEFQIEASEAIGEEDAGIGITIVSRNGEPVVSMATDVQQAPWTKGSSRRWKVRCDMGRLPLNAENYFGTVYLTDGVKVTCIFTNAITLQVIAHDVFGCGRVLPETRYWGPMYSEPEWEIYPVKEDSTFKENK